MCVEQHTKISVKSNGSKDGKRIYKITAQTIHKLRELRIGRVWRRQTAGMVAQAAAAARVLVSRLLSGNTAYDPALFDHAPE